MEILTLQSSLHSEIQAKQAVGEELSRTRAELLASQRRSQKLDKMEILTLQSSLHSEIQAKQAVGEELSRTRAELLASQRYV
ncbi:hypothetical protein PYW07_010799 [Mythimna separata]|uniref:Myotonic dystrophy protein kinase coiled coil domain-containing protein n=1 Tax=Mythimna separata TaxID=271217 RepID=A0AAD7Y850_MYTSE|nr:hypothetical protein PYW07_010791 [Mythimna separata]KAJ8706015.1 hypothetical protein PYW07_010792 [Mythimna separata]KAJ8706016.1 hypothetical protein PYW07_010793 [Mythimna separata]KAJ8706017.1 hypothetical protein PYW07_010794 [Mythimna separata]KAJ8706018.1 hypothetical protein PYW07_010795 [Mythimna separata]